MGLIKLDKKRSYDASKTYKKDGLTYYQINDTYEVCVLVNEPNDIEIIQERICVPSVKMQIPEGEYRVTTMLIDFDSEYNWKNLFHGEIEHPLEYKHFKVKVPKHIERVYFSDNCAKDIRTQCIELDVDADGCLLNDEGVFSSDRKEMFSYGIFSESKKDITLPDCLNVIHSYAFMCAKIKTLRIPATVTEIGKGAFLNAKIDNIIFEGKRTADIDPEAFSNLKVSGSIRFNDTAQNVSACNELLEEVVGDCKKLILAAPSLCEEDSSSIGYIRVTQAYYSNGYYRWNNIHHNEGIIDINTRYIVSVEEYENPTYLPVKGSVIALSGADNDRQQYYIIVYEPKEIVMKKIDTAVKQINASGCTIDELIDRIKNKIK
jgi:hypothetical protein